MRRVSRREVQRRWSSRGFTLLELVVGLALTTLLMAAIYASLSMYMRISNEDTSQIEHSRLARSLFRQMSLDIRSVVFLPSETESQVMEGDTESGSSSTGSDSTGIGDTGTAGDESDSDALGSSASETSSSVTSVGLVGDAVKLVLHVSRPSRDLDYQSLHSGSGLHARTSDLQSITYFIADPRAGGMEGEAGTMAVRSGDGIGDMRSQQIQGLARLAGDEFAVNFADSESDTMSLAASAKIIAPEVVSVDFQYFDGVSWQASWDSVAMGRLPNAVAITIELTRIPTEDERRVAERDSTMAAKLRELEGKVIESRRHVVSLPLADTSGGGL